jgi:hypothetical protein
MKNIRLRSGLGSEEKLFASSAIGKEQFVIPNIPIMAVECGKRVRRLLEHLLSHRNGITELLKVER